MRRTLGLLGAVAGIHLFTALPATAQAALDASADLCPRNALKIYFASGDVIASPQAEALIGKIGETASSCLPDNIDLVAHFDTVADGDRAVSVALERLSRVAADLVSRGISSDRIRIAARAARVGEVPASSLNQIDVLFRKADPAAAEPDEAPPASTVRTVQSQAI